MLCNWQLKPVEPCWASTCTTCSRKVRCSSTVAWSWSVTAQIAEVISRRHVNDFKAKLVEQREAALKDRAFLRSLMVEATFLLEKYERMWKAYALASLILSNGYPKTVHGNISLASIVPYGRGKEYWRQAWIHWWTCMQMSFFTSDLLVWLQSRQRFEYQGWPPTLSMVAVVSWIMQPCNPSEQVCRCFTLRSYLSSHFGNYFPFTFMGFVCVCVTSRQLDVFYPPLVFL